MHTIRIHSNTPTRGASALRKKDGAAKHAAFGVQDTDAPIPTHALFISTALPLESTLTEQDKRAIDNGQTCLGDLEKWRRNWLQFGGGSVEELQRIQGTLRRTKAASTELQGLMDEVSILVAVEIAKRSR